MSATPEQLLEDDAARLLSVTEFDAPVVIEAGAGTGKTTLLVARLATWLTGAGFEARDDETAHDTARRALDGVLALTFTEAAAAEMDERLRKVLRELASGALPRGMHDDAPPSPSLEPRSARASALLDALDRPVATTIHAWCARVLSRIAVEAGVDPLFSVDADGRERRRAVREACEAALARALREDDGPWATLTDEALDPAAIERAVLVLAERGARAQDFAGDPASTERVERFQAELATALEAFEPVRALLVSVKRGVTADVCGTLGALRGVLAADPRALDLRWDAIAASIDSTHVARIAAWAGDDFNKGESAALSEDTRDAAALAADVAAALSTLVRCQPNVLRALHAVVHEVLRDAQSALRSRGFVGYSDLVRGVRDALHDEEAAARVRTGLRQLLVDEFQDTDDVQCAIFGRLALDAPPRERPGLFLVGDPKQSIYAFRGADLAAYEGFVERTGAVPRVLVRNARSTVEILDAVAALVEPAMQRERGLQPRFQPLESRARTRGGPVDVLVCGIDDPNPHNKERASGADLAIAEARMVADELVARGERGAPWKEAAILTRSASHASEILSVLRERGVPYEVAAEKRWYQRREIADALALTACVADPHDLLALTAALRSPWCGIPDAAWLGLAQAGLFDVASGLFGLDAASRARIDAFVEAARTRWPLEMPDAPPRDGLLESLRAALVTLARLRASLRDETAADFVERLETSSASIVTESARYLGAHRRDALVRYFARLRALLEFEDGDARAALRELRRAAREREDLDARRPRTAKRDAVQVMTIHGSKGLEFDEVFVVGAHRRPRGRAGAETEVAEGASIVAGVPSLDWSRAARARERRVSAEQARLLYVATTRAKSRLVLSFAWPKNGIAAERALDGASLVERMSGGLVRAAERIRPALEDSEPRFEAERFAVRTWFDLDVEAARVAALERAHDVDVGVCAAEAGEMRARREAARERCWQPILASLSSVEARSARRGGESEMESSGERGGDRVERGFERDERGFERVEHGDDHTEAANDRHRAPRAVTASRERDHARAIGDAVHAVLERVEPTDDLRSAIAAVRELVLQAAARSLGVQDDDPRALAATDDASALLARFAEGELGRRFVALLPRALGREVALAAPPAASGALGAEVGSIDFLARDEAGEIVVVDFKTERGADLVSHAERHRAQLEAYARVVAEALGLERAPRCEAWFLAEDRAVVVGAGAASGTVPGTRSPR